MRVGIMQPYFLPYIGYFQLIAAVDEFVVYDNIEFSKKGWIQRNRMLMNGSDQMFSLPLKKDSDYLDIRERQLADNYQEEAAKLLRKIQSSYQKAPYYKEVMPLIERCFKYPDPNLFNFLYHSIISVCNYLEIDTKLSISSQVETKAGLKNKDRVMSICKDLGADTYINAIGGVGLYDKTEFSANQLELHFIRSNEIRYKQFDNDFIPYLSILDVLMFNSLETVKNYLKSFQLV